MSRARGLLLLLYGTIALCAGCQLVLGIENRATPLGDAAEAGDAPLADDGKVPSADANVPETNAPDAKTQDVEEPDGGWPGCHPLAPFESVTPVTELNTSGWEI